MLRSVMKKQCILLQLSCRNSIDHNCDFLSAFIVDRQIARSLDRQIVDRQELQQYQHQQEQQEANTDQATATPPAANKPNCTSTNINFDVQLDITGAKMQSVLEQCAALYDVCVRDDGIANDTDVLLRVNTPPEHTEGDKEEEEGGKLGREATSALLRSVSATDLTGELGYTLFAHVAMGGTFDHLHPGHKMLLTSSILHTAARLRCGITGEKLLVNKKHKETLESFEVRRARVLDFISKQRADLIVDTPELLEGTGGTTEIADVSAMVASLETLPYVRDTINAGREKNGFKPVVPVVIPFIGGSDNATRVSSSLLREKIAAERLNAKEKEKKE